MLRLRLLMAKESGNHASTMVSDRHGGVGIEVDFGGEIADPARLRVDPQSEGLRGFERVDDVQIVGPGLGPVLPRVCPRIGADIAVGPTVGGVELVVVLQRLAIVFPLVTEQRPEAVERARVGNEPVPVVVADLVPHVAQQRTVGLAQLGPSPLELDVVGLGQRHRDQPVVVAGHHPGRLIVSGVGQKIEGKATRLILAFGRVRQAQFEQRVEQPVLGDLELAPALEIAGDREVRDRAVVPAGDTVVGVLACRHLPVAGAMDDVGTRSIDRAPGGEGVPFGAVELECAEDAQIGQEPQRPSAALAGRVLEIEHLAAVLAGEQLHRCLD